MVRRVKHKHSETMRGISRRTMLAGGASLIAAPALGAISRPTDVDVAIVGAGAAGIAAARRIAASGQRVVLIEAAPRVGGRCFTDTATFGFPYDRGARGLRSRASNPVAKLADSVKLDIEAAPRGQRIRIGRRNAREGELEDFLAASVRANRAIGDAVRGGKDIAAAQALPKELGDWRATVEFMLGPYATSKELTEVSAADLARGTDRAPDGYCRQGYGALVAALATGLRVQRDNPVTRVEWSGRDGVALETKQGRLAARAVIVTVSTGVLASDAIRFTPDLPRRHADAIARLKPGAYERIALLLDGNPLGLPGNDLVFEKAGDARTGVLLANVGRTPLCTVDVGGAFARELAGQGQAAMVAFATEWLAGLYGADVKRAIGKSHATGWTADPLIRGGWSSPSPGGAGARAVLREGLSGRLWFAGEASHDTAWGSVEGAWDSGERAAVEILRSFGVLKEERPAAKAKGAVTKQVPKQ